MKNVKKKKKEDKIMLRFTDGMEFDTSANEMLPIHESDGWYACGKNKLIPCKDKEQAMEICEAENRGEKI